MVVMIWHIFILFNLVMILWMLPNNLMRNFRCLSEIQNFALSCGQSCWFFLLCLQFYSPKNTIMFDDLRRNFVLNPQNGLTIKPFRRAHANRDSDQELVKLTQYLLAIADLDDLSNLDHNKWEFYIEDNTKRRRHAWVMLATFQISNLSV